MDSTSLLRYERDFELILESKPKPEMSFEDLRCLFRHHWVDDKKRYPTERQRIQMSLLLLLSAFTASRPGAILANGSAQESRNQFLRYRDIELMLVAEPGKRDIWVMKVTFMFLKAHQVRSNP